MSFFKTMHKGFSALVIPLLILLFIASTFITIIFLHSKTQETKTTTSQQNTTKNDCNGLAAKSLNDIKWNTYKDKENNFSIEYPSVFKAEKTPNGIGFKTNDNEKASIIWLSVYDNAKKQNITQVWTESPPNDHAGELTSASYSQRLINANQLLKNALQVNVGSTNIKGYSLTIGDTLERTSIYWLANNNIYNLGFSPQDKSYGCLGDKKAEIVNHMLSSFQPIDPLSQTVINWKTFSNDKISFKYPDHFYISEDKNGITTWRSTFGDFLMILKTSNEAITNPKINQDFTLSDNNKIKVLYIGENKPIQIDGKTTQWFSFGCLADCSFHMISFNAGDKYYQLIFDVAGAGLSDTFGNILSTFQFSNN